MPRITVLFGLVLVILGLVAYFGSTPENLSKTALIPAFLGGPLILCGAIAHKDKLRMHAMHGAVLIGLLGGLGALVKGVMGLADFNRATGFQLATAAICLVFTFLCVKSFIDAKRRRLAAQAMANPTGADDVQN
ncbi:MAG: hypothetical protein O3A00_09630 [Planctomycetota bacterium]|nr:hypothetical protein [Planctomycetota bacterium]